MRRSIVVGLARLPADFGDYRVLLAQFFFKSRLGSLGLVSDLQDKAEHVGQLRLYLLPLDLVGFELALQLRDLGEITGGHRAQALHWNPTPLLGPGHGLALVVLLKKHVYVGKAGPLCGILVPAPLDQAPELRVVLDEKEMRLRAPDRPPCRNTGGETRALAYHRARSSPANAHAGSTLTLAVGQVPFRWAIANLVVHRAESHPWLDLAAVDTGSDLKK